MSKATPLPDAYARGYHAWRETGFADRKEAFRDLADNGQSPSAMVISCCDSRVHPTSIFSADEGEIFIHRNIANFVPPHDADGVQTGTAAAVEFAVTALNVSHLIVMGHSLCGGVKGCHQKCSGEAPGLDDPQSFVGRWVEELRPAYERLPQNGTPDEMEREAVKLSIENLMGYSFVRDAVSNGSLTLHGLHFDIGAGTLTMLDPDTNRFIEV